MPEFAAETWTGLYAPKGLPADVLAKLRDAVARSLADPATQERFLKTGATVPSADRRGGHAMHKLVEGEVARWVDILKKANLPEQQ